MNERWINEFPRLCELREEAIRQKQHGFLASTPDVIHLPHVHGSYKQLEDDLETLDKTAWQYLKGEVLQCRLAPDPTWGFSSVMDRLHEASGYVYLRKCGYTAIWFVPTSQEETPDLEASSNDLGKAFLEVKTIRPSLDEMREITETTRRLKAGELPKIRRITPDLEAGFWNKLKVSSEKATSQLLKFQPGVKARRIVFFVIRLDHGPSMDDNNYDAIKSCLKMWCNGVTVVCRFPNLGLSE